MTSHSDVLYRHRDDFGRHHWSEKCPKCGAWTDYQSHDRSCYEAALASKPSWCGQCFASKLHQRNME